MNKGRVSKLPVDESSFILRSCIREQDIQSFPQCIPPRLSSDREGQMFVFIESFLRTCYFPTVTSTTLRGFLMFLHLIFCYKFSNFTMDPSHRGWNPNGLWLNIQFEADRRHKND